MRVTLFGTRGSIPAPGPETVRYGGNTVSVQVCGKDGTVLVLDAGTGIRRLGMQVSPITHRIDILLTHLHMDHIQGLGFFGPLFDPRFKVHIWGPASSTLKLEARLARYLSPPLFPVHLRDMPKVVCHEVPCPSFEIGPFRIQNSLVCHPGPTVGYRIESEDGVVAYLCDHEPALGLLNGRWPSRDWISGYEVAWRPICSFMMLNTQMESINVASDGETVPTATLLNLRRRWVPNVLFRSTTIPPTMTTRSIGYLKTPRIFSNALVSRLLEGRG